MIGAQTVLPADAHIASHTCTAGNGTQSMQAMQTYIMTTMRQLSPVSHALPCNVVDARLVQLLPSGWRRPGPQLCQRPQAQP
jgi:hypothetical protein